MRRQYGVEKVTLLLALVLVFVRKSSASPLTSSQINKKQSVADNPKPLRVLLFTKAVGWRHESIPIGEQFFAEKALEYGWDLRTERDADVISVDVLENIDIVIFFQTTGSLFTAEWQQTALKKFIQRGGGYVAVHGASDGDQNWEWYKYLLGAYFESHPKIQAAQMLVSANHAITDPLPRRWTIMDEWYNFKHDPSSRKNVTVLVSVNEDTYEGGTMGRIHPISWCQDYDGGRSFYTSVGHRDVLYTDSYYKPFQDHIIAGILWASGGTSNSIYSDIIVYPSPTPSPEPKPSLGPEVVKQPDLAPSSSSSGLPIEIASTSESTSKLITASPSPPQSVEAKLRVLVFKQLSSESAFIFLQKVALSRGWTLEIIADVSEFTDSLLSRIDVLIWSQSKGNLLNSTQREVFKRFIRSGKGYVGVSSAIEAEPSWPYYKNMLGSNGTPTGSMDRKTTVRQLEHETVSMMPKNWVVADKWFNLNQILPPGTKLLLSLVDRSPIAWCRKFDTGRIWYTTLGHRNALYANDSYFKPFQNHLIAGIEWAGNSD